MPRPAASRRGPASLVAVDPDRSPLRRARLDARTIQVILGLTWIVAGALQFQPFMFSRGFAAQVIAPTIKGQPGWVGAPMTWSLHALEHHGLLLNAACATVQTLIGLGLLFRRTVKPALVASIGWAIGVWWFGEGFGELLTGTASPLTGAPGAVILYALVGVLVWPSGVRQAGEPAAGSEPGRSGGPPRAIFRTAGLGGRVVAGSGPLAHAGQPFGRHSPRRIARRILRLAHSMAAIDGPLGPGPRIGHRHRVGHDVSADRAGSARSRSTPGRHSDRCGRVTGLLGPRPGLRGAHQRKVDRCQRRAPLRAPGPPAVDRAHPLQAGEAEAGPAAGRKCGPFLIRR